MKVCFIPYLQIDIDITISGTTYRNGDVNPDWNVTDPAPIDGGKIDGIPTNPEDPKIYFYKGLESANCIEFLISLGLL